MPASNYPYIQSRILNRLRLAEGGVISEAEMRELIWPDPDDEPEFPSKVIRNAIRFLREKLFPIKNHCGRGYSFEWQHWELLDEVPHLRGGGGEEPGQP